MKNRIILSGLAGTGKTTVGKALSSRLGYEFVSIGTYSRDFAYRVYGMDINEFQAFCKKNPIIDQQLDNKFIEEYSGMDYYVADYRLGFHFLNPCFSVLLTVTPEKAVERIQGAARIGEKTTIEAINSRNMEMRNRFIDIYKLDFTKSANYEMTLDTTLLTPDECVELICRRYEKYEKH